MPPERRGFSPVSVRVITNVSRKAVPFDPSIFYRGKVWAGRLGRRLAVWVGTSLKIFGGFAVVWMGTVPSWANPVGEQVVAGAATFQRVGNSLTIQQGTDRAVINWNQFSIAAGETTKFVMPSASSAALNRVLSGNPSAIYGSLQANGHLFLINPAGILVGPGGTINTASFIASTRDVSNEAFMHGGDLGFLGDSAAAILNQGKIEATSGDVFLIAQHVENEGQLMARDGTVGMVSGTQVSLQSVGPQNFKVRLAEVPDEVKIQKDKDGVADVVNEGVIEAANAVLEATGNVGSLAINNRGTIRATGVRPNADGSVTLTGGEGDVLNSGVIAALRKNMEGKEVGGEIRIAGQNITTEETSLITASGATEGGSLRMRATDTTLISGRVEATGYGDQAKGGRVELLGKKVGLRSGEVNADGGARGGTVLVGGDYLGSNPEVPNAETTVIMPDARISADASANGDGGKVIVWSDEYTGFFGEITALGGPQGGNGGFIETSSANNLQAFGKARANAPAGLPGQWLLDPSQVIIGTAPTSGETVTAGNPTIFTPQMVNTAFILNTQINDALNLGTSVTITTGSAATLDCGEIIINAPITKTFGGNATLTLDSDSGITINADITSVANSLFMNFQADSNADGFGTFTLAAGANLFSNGGNITVSAGDVVLEGTMNTLRVLQAAVGVNAGGSYAVGTVPTVTIAAPAAVGGVAASATALMGLGSASVINGGTGYTGVPTVRVVGGGGQNAVLTPTMGVPTGSAAVTIAIAGFNYSVGDTVSVAGGGGGAGAVGTVTAVNASGGITAVNISATGSNYTSLPAANVQSVNGTGACIEINQLSVVGISVANPGTGYTGGMTLQINGGGGSGATAAVNSMQVVNLAFSGAASTPYVAAPSYGVGYANGQTLQTSAGEVVFSGTGAGGANVNIGPLVSVAGDILLKPSAANTTLGIGTGDGAFEVSNAELGRLTVNSSILPGTVILGTRAAGAIEVGGVNFGNQNLTLASGGLITGENLEGLGNNITMTGGLLTLDTAAGVGTSALVGGGLQLSSPRVAIVTEGNFFNLFNSAKLTQFHVTTDGTVAGQRVLDDQPGVSNLNWFVQETANTGSAGGNTSIFGISVLDDSVDIRYQNSLGSIEVLGGGVSSVLVDSVNAGATGVAFSAPTVPGGVQATGLIAGGLVTITNPGSGYLTAPTVTLTGGTSAQNFAGLGTLNVQPANNGTPATFRDFILSAPLGTITTTVPIFSGGGNLTLQSQNIVLPFDGSTRFPLILTDVPGAELPTVAYANLGVLNAFEALTVPVSEAAGTLTYIGGAFGSRTRLLPSVNGAGAISGTGGVLSIEATSAVAEGRNIDFSPAGGFANTMNISVLETQLLEAPGIRIGGPQTADILMRTMFTPLIFRQEVTTRITGGNPETTGFDYDPRYFENPFFNATRLSLRPVNVSSDSGVPHVTGGTISLVSALGDARNVRGGDVNVSALSLTGVDGVFFDARSQNGTYAGLSLATANGSIMPAVSARVGRTLQDGTTIGNGGDVTLNLNYTTAFVNDGRLPIAAGFTDYSQIQAASGTATVAGGEVASVNPNNNGMLYRYEPVVTITGGGVQEASLRAVLDGTGVALIAPQIVGQGYTPSVLDPATGLTTGPDVSIIGNGSGAAVGNGGRAFISDNGIISVITLLDGGSGYNPAAPPQVIISGGGSSVTRPAVARTEVNSLGQVSAVIIVDPGAGYSDTTPVSILVQAPGTGGVRARAVLDSDFRPSTFGNSLNPIYVSKAGSGYTVEPSVAITGGGVRQAQARAILDADTSSNVYGKVVGFEITDPGLGYVSAPTITVGSGQAFGNFGEYGVSTETVDRNVGSGNISISNGPFPIVGGLILNAPVRTGDAEGVPGGDAVSGSILLDIYVDLSANSNNSATAVAPNPGGARGIIITGDAGVVPGDAGTGNARSGSITMVARSINNNTTSASTLATLTGSAGIPVQIGTATGGVSNISGNLNAALELRDITNTEVGDLQIYAPAPGQVQTALGNVPLDPNHAQGSPRTSNDLAISGLVTPETSQDSSGNVRTDESLVTVEVGAFEGKLTLLRRAESQATATVVNGRVTLISPDKSGQLFAQTPTVVITGGGIVPAEASVFVSNGVVLAPDGTNILEAGNGLDVPGQGYFTTPTVAFSGGGGAGATGVAVLETNADGIPTGRIARVIITDPGYGYTSLPIVEIGPPLGVQATATATITGTGSSATATATITQQGLGYSASNPPSVIVTGGIQGTATAEADVNSLSQIIGIKISLNGDTFPEGVTPVLTIGPPAGTAQATANLVNGTIGSFTISSPGGGYSSAPNVLLVTGATTPYDLTLDRVGFIADRLQLFDSATPSSLLIEAGLAAIAPWTNQRPVTIGTTVPGTTSYLLSDISRFLADDLVVGRRNPTHIGVGAGEITISAAVAADNLRISNGIFIAGTRGVADLGGVTGISFEAAAINVGSTVNLTGSGNKLHYLAGIIQGPFEELSYGKPFALSSALRTAGTSVMPLTIGDIYGNPAYFTGQRFNQGITTQNGNVTLLADQLGQSRLTGYIDTTGTGKYPVGTTGPDALAGSARVNLAPLTPSTAVSIYYNRPGSGLALRIGNPAAPGLELVRAGTVQIGNSTTGNIVFESDFGFNYRTYPNAPRALIVQSAGEVVLGTSQIPPSPSPTRKTSSILVPVFSVSASSASLGAFGTSASPDHQVEFLAASLTGPNQSFFFSSAANSLSVADLSSLGGAQGISTSGSLVTLAANQINVLPMQTSGLASIRATGARVILQPRTAQAIQLGVTEPKTGFSFTDAELDRIAANFLQISSGTLARSIIVAGPVTLNATTAPAITSGFTLISAGPILDLGGSSGISYEGPLRLSSKGAISFTGTGNNFGTVAANSGGNPITLSSGPFSIGTADGLTGITASGSRVTLQPNMAGTAITLGAPAPGAWGFSSSELALVNASTLQIGNRNTGPGDLIPSSGAITVNAAVTLPAAVSTLVLETGQGVADGGGSTGVAVDSLAIRAGIGNVGLDGGGNRVSNLAGTVANGSFSFTDNNASATSPLRITTIDGIAGINTAAGNGNVTLTADDIVIDTTILQTILAGSGTITLQPQTLTTPISLNDPSNSLSLSILEMQRLNTTGTVVIGNVAGTGTISLGGSGTLNLASKGYSLTLRGASSDLVFNGGVILGNGKTFSMNLGSGAVSSPFAGTDVTINGGTITIPSAGSVGTTASPLRSAVTFLGQSAVAGQLNLFNNSALTVNGPVQAGGNIYLSSSAGLFANLGLGTIRSTAGTTTLEGNTMALAANIFGANGINLQPFSSTRTIGVFDGAAGGFQISNAEFAQLQGVTPVTIGRSNSQGNVTVAGGTVFPARNLTIQAPYQTFGKTFNVTGPLVNNGGNLTLNAGGGSLSTASTISLGAGAAYLTGQAISLGNLLTANGGVVLANGNPSGDTYLNLPVIDPTADLQIGAATLNNISTTGFVGIGSTSSSTAVVVGSIVVGGAGFNFGGLELLAGINGSIQLQADLNSNGKPVYIDGPLLLSASRAIDMTNGGTVPAGASLSLLNGLRGIAGTEDLTVTLGTAANVLTLAGGLSTDRIGTLNLALGSGTITLGTDGTATPANLQPGPNRGLNLGVTQDLSLPGPITLQSDQTVSVRAYNGADLQIGTASGSVTALDLAAKDGGTLQVGSVTARDVTLLGDVLDLNGNILAVTGNATVGSGTTSRGFTVGTGGDLTAADLLRIQAPAGEVRMGAQDGTGGVVLIGPVNLAASLTETYRIQGEGGGLTFLGAGPVLTLPAGGKLILSIGNGGVTSSGGIDLSISGGELEIMQAGQVTIRTAISTVRQTGGTLAGLNLVNTSSLVLAGSFNTGSGNILVQTLSGNLTLGGTMAGGLIQLGAAQNFINQAGSNPFTNVGGGRTLIYSDGQRYDLPYNFAGLNGFGVAFGRGFGSMPGSGNFLVYSQYAQTALDDGVVYYEMFSGNSVSALLALNPELFWSVNGQMIPKTRPGGYIDYMLYPQRVEPATMTLPEPVLSRLEQKLGRPPTVAEIAADEAERRRNRMLRTGGWVERNSFDAEVEPRVEAKKQIRADRADGHDSIPVIPQAQAAPVPAVPTAKAIAPGESSPQAGKSKEQNQEVKGPGLRRGPNRAVALRAEPIDASKILAEEREKAEVNLAAPVAAGK